MEWFIKSFSSKGLFKDKEVLLSILENLDERVTVVDQDFRVIYTNLKPEDPRYTHVMGKRTLDTMRPELLEEARKCHLQAFNGISCYNEMTAKILEGPERWWSSQFHPFETAEGQKCALVISKDVTAQKAISQKLNLLDTLNKNIPDYILLFDEKLRIKYVNRTQPTDFVKSPIGNSPYDIPEKEDREEIVGKFLQAKKTGKVQTYERVIENPKTKEKVFLDNRVSFVPNSKPDEYVVSVRDITERMRIQKVVDQQKEQLFTASKLAALGEMSAGVAHEINNPLAIILGRVSQLKRVKEKDYAGSRVQDIIDNIEQHGQRIAEIIQSLRMYARDGRNDKYFPEDLNGIIENTLTLCRERLKDKGVQIKFDSLSKVQVPCRATQVSQVLLNLLGNAFDAVEGMTNPWVNIQLKEDVHRAVINVVDSGKKIPSDITDKIMNPFFTTKPLGKGTGLGLSISSGIIEDHQGRLYFDPKETNTTFKIELPKRRV